MAQPVICTTILFSILLLIGLSRGQQSNEPVFLGRIPHLAHETSGKVYALDDRTLKITNLNYDGLAPDAYFWAGSTKKPTSSGFPIPDESGSLTPLKGYRNATVVLRLPQGKTLRDIKYFGLWCRQFRQNFGHITVNYQ